MEWSAICGEKLSVVRVPLLWTIFLCIHRFDLVYIPMESPKIEYAIKYWKVNMSRLLMYKILLL